ncbi:helix-turn-helix domain-containing protein [Actinomadura opuntiae]|uniref:helix-turn-helix domain-containing protein n=1 Tax=Actinomadura sp. OS1-43 TaxID=604315 RepID=UPI00255B1D32|nr:helix-turn-helix transcriptional regulator [Actinomadura sp. OS1-43]MDL4821171.1 helix-turn-helix transcriptional regulator [Actinomadura sp. OS1-43]
MIDLIRGRRLMPSPYVRRRRLAAELRKIREERNMTSDDLAGRVYMSRTKITRLENAQVRPDLIEIMSILDVLEVTGREHERIVRLTRDAGEKRWWDRFGDSMGPRQKLYADLESGADTIRSYDQTAMPAALQTAEFIEALIELDACQGPLAYRPERMAEARTLRQARLLAEDGPAYGAVLDETMLHRLAIPPAVKAAQLRRLVDLVEAEERITIQVLSADRPVPGGFLPKSSFSLYTFPEPGDPSMAVIDTVTTDVIMTKRAEIARYVEMYDRLCKAALPPEDSLTFLSRVADRLTDAAGSEV